MVFAVLMLTTLIGLCLGGYFSVRSLACITALLALTLFFANAHYAGDIPKSYETIVGVGLVLLFSTWVGKGFASLMAHVTRHDK
jgi:predicted esterase YcpF (UPF0227 family)